MNPAQPQLHEAHKPLGWAPPPPPSWRAAKDLLQLNPAHTRSFPRLTSHLGLAPAIVPVLELQLSVPSTSLDRLKSAGLGGWGGGGGLRRAVE